ncbi:MAG: class I SAM-dependent methyltransferase [Planctomycetota bacterium]
MSTDDRHATSSPMLADYFRLMACNGADHVYRTAIAAGLFDELRGGALGVEALATKTSVNPEALRLALDVLAALGLVTYEDEAACLTALAVSLMDGPYRALGDPYWKQLPEFLRTAEPMTHMDDPAESEAQYVGQAAALAWMLGPAAAWAAGHLTSDGSPADPCNILDAGAGSAIWSLSCAARLPEARVTSADWPAVLEVARATALRMGLADRLTLLPGDLAKTELPREEFDLAILANVAHLLTPDALTALTERLVETLRPGGRLAVIDVFPGLAAGDLNRALYTLGLALRTRTGQTHQPQAVKQQLEHAGLVEVKFAPIDCTPHTLGVVVGRRFR